MLKPHSVPVTPGCAFSQARCSPSCMMSLQPPTHSGFMFFCLCLLAFVKRTLWKEPSTSSCVQNRLILLEMKQNLLDVIGRYSMYSCYDQIATRLPCRCCLLLLGNPWWSPLQPFTHLPLRAFQNTACNSSPSFLSRASSCLAMMRGAQLSLAVKISVQ